MSVKEGAYSEVCVDPRPVGARAVFLVETHTSEEAQEIRRLFVDLEDKLQVRQLCTGKLVSYAVQCHDADVALIDEIDALLKSTYSFVVTQRSYDDVIYRIVTELCADTGSKLLPMPRCHICGRIDPFPSVLVSLSDADGRVRTSRNYCASCAAGATATSHKEFVRSLLASDKRSFRSIERAELVRRRSSRQPIRYRIGSTI